MTSVYKEERRYFLFDASSFVGLLSHSLKLLIESVVSKVFKFFFRNVDGLFTLKIVWIVRFFYPKMVPAGLIFYKKKSPSDWLLSYPAVFKTIIWFN